MPVGRPPKPIDPSASAAAAFGADIRARRTEREWTLQALSDEIGYSPQHISDAELAKNPVSEHFAAAVDRVLDADGRLLALLDAVVIERAFERQKRASARRAAATLNDDVKRRAFLGLGLALVLLGPEAVARASADDWDRIAHQWMREVAAADDRQVLLPGLTTDLRRLAGGRRPTARDCAASGMCSDDRTEWRRSRHGASLVVACACCRAGIRRFTLGCVCRRAARVRGCLCVVRTRSRAGRRGQGAGRHRHALRWPDARARRSCTSASAA
jgi:transcriptional regulator with XRE-family HTH domain